METNYEKPIGGKLDITTNSGRELHETSLY